MTENPSDLPKCTDPRFKELFFSLTNSDVSPGERQRIEEHLAICSECRSDVLFFLDLQKAWQRKQHWTSGS